MSSVYVKGVMYIDLVSTVWRYRSTAPWNVGRLYQIDAKLYDEGFDCADFVFLIVSIKNEPAYMEHMQRMIVLMDMGLYELDFSLEWKHLLTRVV